MTAVVRITIEALEDEYNGVSKASGNPYTIGTWRVKGVVDNKVFVVKAFTNMHDIIKVAHRKGMEIDATIDISASEYKGKLYNNINVTGIMNQEAITQDVPTTEVANSAPVQESVVETILDDTDDVLPF